LEIKGDTPDTLNKLYDLLEEDKLRLLLPEVIQLEFYQILEDKADELKRSVDRHKEEIGKDNSLDDKISDDLIEKLDDCINDRGKNKEEVKKTIEKIFSHKNTVKLQISNDTLIKAYKYSLSKKKPFKKSQKEEGKIEQSLQGDCLIISTLEEFLNKEKDFEFYFCSRNKSDFADNKAVADKDMKIHKDIKKNFAHIEYYLNLFQLLNDKLGTDYSADAIAKLKKLGEEENLSISSSGEDPILDKIIDSEVGDIAGIGSEGLSKGIKKSKLEPKK